VLSLNTSALPEVPCAPNLNPNLNPRPALTAGTVTVRNWSYESRLVIAHCCLNAAARQREQTSPFFTPWLAVRTCAKGFFAARSPLCVGNHQRHCRHICPLEAADCRWRRRHSFGDDMPRPAVTMRVHVLPLETRVAKFRVALPSKLRTCMHAVVAACEANCDPQGFLLALSAFSSAETNRSRTWSSIQKSFGAAVCCPLGTGGESLRFNCSKIELTFYWRIHCDDMGRVHQSARLVPNILDSNLSKNNNAMLMKLSATFGKLAKTVGISCAILDILSRC